MGSSLRGGVEMRAGSEERGDEGGPGKVRGDEAGSGECGDEGGLGQVWGDEGGPIEKRS